MNSCSHPHNYTISKECEFIRIVDSKFLSGNKEQLAKIKKNNIDACHNCVQEKNLIKCKKALRERQKIRKRLERENKKH